METGGWTLLINSHPNLVADAFKALAQTSLARKRPRLSSNWRHTNHWSIYTELGTIKTNTSHLMPIIISPSMYLWFFFQTFTFFPLSILIPIAFIIYTNHTFINYAHGKIIYTHFHEKFIVLLTVEVYSWGDASGLLRGLNLNRPIRRRLSGLRRGPSDCEICRRGRCQPPVMCVRVGREGIWVSFLRNCHL